MEFEPVEADKWMRTYDVTRFIMFYGDILDQLKVAPFHELSSPSFKFARCVFDSSDLEYMGFHFGLRGRFGRSQSGTFI